MPNELELRYIVDEKTGQRVLPITHMSAVRDSDGNTLPTLMAPEKNGTGIGTCSTSSGTALAVNLTGYELVQNGFIAVTFANDVPANATLNVNDKGAKPIIYKGSAIEADTIKADDTVMFAYDGTNYVVTSLGGGSAPLTENIVIYLEQVGGNASDLNGATITIKDSNNTTLYTYTWNGISIPCTISGVGLFTISVSAISGYITPKTKTYAVEGGSRNVILSYINNIGVYIEDTEHNMYTASTWNSSKTPNSICIFTSTRKTRYAIEFVQKQFATPFNANIQNYLPALQTEAAANSDFNGKTNTDSIISFCIANNINNNSYAGPYCRNYIFPDGETTGGYLMASGQFKEFVANRTAFNTCLTSIGRSAFQNQFVWTSSYIDWNTVTNNPMIIYGSFGTTSGGTDNLNWSGHSPITNNYYVIPVTNYE